MNHPLVLNGQEAAIRGVLSLIGGRETLEQHLDDWPGGIGGEADDTRMQLLKVGARLYAL